MRRHLPHFTATLVLGLGVAAVGQPTDCKCCGATPGSGFRGVQEIISGTIATRSGLSLGKNTEEGSDLRAAPLTLCCGP